jgi:seryl-tRNA synthetase
MLDIKFIRENKDLIALGAKKKHIAFDVDALLAVDDARRALMASIEKHRAEQNEASRQIMTTNSVIEKGKLISSMQFVKDRLVEDEEKLKEVMKDWQMLMLAVPNIPDMSVPEGVSDADNKEVKTWGEKPKFDFTPKNHIDLMLALGIADFERGTKVAGFRGYFLKGDGALLTFALWQYALKFFSGKNFTPMIVPSVVRREPLMGTGFLPQSEDDIYKVQDELYLAGTGEVATMGYHMDEVLDKKDLPKKYISFSPCFRREIGAHAKDVKGLIRVHEFYKFEQVILCEASHEESVRYHEELTRNTEEFIESLGIPYHTVVNCGADLGLGQVKKYDIELWVPLENTYREIGSASYFHDFQTRRLGIRYKDSDGKMRFAHSLNNTAVPVPRILVSLVENFQQADGSIRIPDALVPYMGKSVITL